MNDCPNAEMRDLLPDLLHDRLSAAARTEVTAHVDACADCREELALLREVHRVLVARTPRVDVASVVGALPKPRARTTTGAKPRRTWADWRIAAAVTMIAVGGTSVAIVRKGEQSTQPNTPVALAPTQDTATQRATATIDSTALVALNTPAAPTASTEPRSEPTESGGLSMAGHLADLDESQLKSLLSEIEQMKAVPITEPEPVAIKVDPRSPSMPEGR